MMVATDELEKRHWAEIGKHIEFKEEAALLARYLGANYNIDKFSLKEPNRARQNRVSMTNYLHALVTRFQDEHPDAKLYPVTSPYLPEAQWTDANDQPGVYQAQCASYVASALFASLAGRPGISTAVRRLTTRVTRWTVPDDAALVRLMAYLKTEASLELVGTLSPDDVTGLQLELSTDADWNGDDACTSRSVSGMHLELVNPKSGNVFPLAWRSSGQSAASCSTAVALSHGLDLVQEFLGERIPLVCLHAEEGVENMWKFLCLFCAAWLEQSGIIASRSHLTLLTVWCILQLNPQWSGLYVLFPHLLSDSLPSSTSTVYTSVFCSPLFASTCICK